MRKGISGGSLLRWSYSQRPWSAAGRAEMFRPWPCASILKLPAARVGLASRSPDALYASRVACRWSFDVVASNESYGAEGCGQAVEVVGISVAERCWLGPASSLESITWPSGLAELVIGRHFFGASAGDTWPASLLAFGCELNQPIDGSCGRPTCSSYRLGSDSTGLSPQPLCDHPPCKGDASAITPTGPSQESCVAGLPSAPVACLGPA